MIHKRKITKHKRPKTIQQAFALFREIACDLPTKPDPEMSQRQLQIAFEQAVEAYSRRFVEDADKYATAARTYRKALGYAMRLNKSVDEWSFWDRLRFVFGSIPGGLSMPSNNTDRSPK
jgi:hypothetical protein